MSERQSLLSDIGDMVYLGGSCLQDIELLRNDETWLDALGAQIIPYPTTAGDFLRRLSEAQIGEFMEVKNTVRGNIWQKQPPSFRREAIINIDGTIYATDGECKQGMDISYNGQGISSIGDFTAQHPWTTGKDNC